MRPLVILLNRTEAAERLRVSLATVKRYGAAGLLDERRVGPRLVKITEASVEALLRAGRDRKAAVAGAHERASGSGT